ncbi:MAG: hypothetical protein RL660_2392 [Bacteroidota bacterium]|jgi:photosystem II stability/assembly factor-like uncharacterized protein
MHLGRVVAGVFLLWVLSISALAQKTELDLLLDTTKNFFTAQVAAEAYFTKKMPPRTTAEVPYADNEYNRYKRWEYYWQNRIMPDGSMPDPRVRHKVYMQEKNRRTRSGGGTWKNISQTTSLSGYNGMGRITSVAFHPTEVNTFYISAPKGGVWKTTNGGQTWQAKGDELPTLAAGKVVVDPFAPNTLYLTMSDRPGWWQYTIGIYKSTNGGDTWYPTGKTYAYTDEVSMQDLQISPIAQNTLFAAASDGLWKSTDSGATWAKKATGEFHQIEFKVGNPQIMFASKHDYWGVSQVMISYDHGETWTAASNFNHTNNYIKLAICQSDSNSLYATCSAGGTNYLYKSTDGGLSYTLVSNNMPSHDYFIVSPNNSNKIYSGEVVVKESIDGGQNFLATTHWYNNGVLPTVHADVRYLGYNPLTPNVIWHCNDGGLYTYNEATDTWQDLSDGLIITQFYKLACAQDDTMYVIGGTQDNGGRQRISATQWTATNGGDAMQQAVSRDDEQTIYTTYVDGQLYRSRDRWNNDTYYDITPDPNDGGAWVAPYELSPVDNTTIFAGYSDVYRSDAEGDGWSNISTNLTGNNNTNLRHMALCKANRDMVFAATTNRLFITRNNGANWQQLGVSNNVTDEQVSGLAIHPYNTQITYYTKGGYNGTRKVMRSSNGGTSYVDVSYNLPAMPVNCIFIDEESDSSNVEIYIATDVGVYFKKDQDTQWQYWGTGLPNTECSDLAINYKTGKLYVSTYGRGIWEAKINREIIATPPASVTTVVEPTINISLQGRTLQLTQEAQLTSKLVLTDGAGKQLAAINIVGAQQIDLSNYANGIYFVTTYTNGVKKSKKICLK